MLYRLQAIVLIEKPRSEDDSVWCQKTRGVGFCVVIELYFPLSVKAAHYVITHLRLKWQNCNRPDKIDMVTMPVPANMAHSMLQEQTQFPSNCPNTNRTNHTNKAPNISSNTHAQIRQQNSGYFCRHSRRLLTYPYKCSKSSPQITPSDSRRNRQSASFWQVLFFTI